MKKKEVKGKRRTTKRHKAYKKKMTGVNTTKSVITLKVNELNHLVKSKNGQNGLKINPNYRVSTRDNEK